MKNDNKKIKIYNEYCQIRKNGQILLQYKTKKYVLGLNKKICLSFAFYSGP